MSKKTESNIYGHLFWNTLLAGGVGAAVTAASGGVVPVAAVGVAAAGGMISNILGFFGNILADKKREEEELAPATAEEIGINHHLARLAGHALRTICEQAKKEHDKGSFMYRAFEHCEQHAEYAWRYFFSSAQQHAFQTIGSKQLTDLAAQHAKAPGTVTTLTLLQWLPFTKYLLSNSGLTANAPDADEKLALQISEEFASHFFEHAKLSATKDPAAFAALLLQFLSELRLSQQQHNHQLDQIGERLSAVLQTVEGLAKQTASNPSFDWSAFTAFMVRSHKADEEARAFYAHFNKQWTELSATARGTWSLVQQVSTTQQDQRATDELRHSELMSALTGNSEFLKDEIMPLLRERAQEPEKASQTVTLIIKTVEQRNEKTREAEQQLQVFREHEKRAAASSLRHYYQGKKWTTGRRTWSPWREPGAVAVVRPPLMADASALPPPGTTYYLWGATGHGKSVLASLIVSRLLDHQFKAIGFDLRHAPDVFDHLATLVGADWLALAPGDRADQTWENETAKSFAALTWLARNDGMNDPEHPPYSLVWDNVDDPAILNQILELGLVHHRGVQIITSRISPKQLCFPKGHAFHDGLPRNFTVIPVGPYTETEAREHLRLAGEVGERQGTGGPALADHNRLLQLARLPDQANRFDPLRLRERLDILGRHNWNIISAFGPMEAKGSAPIPVQTDAEVLAQLLAGLTPLAQIVWQLLVQLAQAPIPEEFWKHVADALRGSPDLTVEQRQAVREGLQANLAIDQVKGALASAGLLIAAGSDGYLIHTRHHAAGRSLVPILERPAFYHIAVRLLWAAAPVADPHDQIETWPFYRAAEPHLLAALAADRVEHLLDMEDICPLTHRFNKYLLTQSRPNEALPIAQINLAAIAKQDGIDSETYAVSLHELARVHLALERFAEAEAGFQQALVIMTKHHGEDHPSTAITIHELARVHMEEGRYAEAERGFQQALVIKTKHFGADHPSAVATIHELARVRLEQGRHVEAETGLQQALAISIKHYGEDHPETATIIHELARVRLEQGRYTEAETGFQQTLVIDTKHHGEDSWHVALIRAHLSRCAWALGRIGEAERQFPRAAEAMAAKWGKEHRRYASVLHYWAACELGHIPGVPPLVPLTTILFQRIRQALSVRSTTLSPNHPHTAKTRLLMADALRRNGQLDEARTHATAAAKDLAAALPAEHAANQQARALLAVLK